MWTCLVANEDDGLAVSVRQAVEQRAACPLDSQTIYPLGLHF